MAVQFSSQEQKIMQTSSNEVFFPRGDDYDAWRREVGDYITKKTEFQGKADPYMKVSNKMVKEMETRYNPITQVYTDKAREEQARKTE